jgi:glutathione S-transferase
MKVFWAPQTRSTRAIWMLEEAGIDYVMQLVDIRSPDREDSEEFLAASPMGKVPAIIDGDVAMSESAAICIYVADKYGAGTLAPNVHDPARGKYLYWTIYSAAVIEPAMAEKFADIAPNRGRNGWGDFELMIQTFDAGLEGKDWILGDRFTAADVMLGSSAVFMRMFDMLPETRNIGKYADRCLARPAFQKTTEVAGG